MPPSGPAYEPGSTPVPSTLPAISIVTPTRNRRSVLLRAIESVQKQTLGDYEHIVVDDGSQDGTEAAVASIRDARLRYVRLDGHRGANAARNLAIDLAKSSLVTFLDSDDEFLSLRLERSVALFATDPGIDLAVSSFNSSKEGRLNAAVNRQARLTGPTLERVVSAQAVALAGSALTVRKTALKAVGGFDEDLWRFQDRDLLLRLAAAGYSAEFVEEIDWVKHRTADSISQRVHGYVESYGALLARHPSLRARYPDIAAYMVARRILGNLWQGRLGAIAADLRANDGAPALGFTPAKLAAGYVRGRRQRRSLARELKNPASVEHAGDAVGVPAVGKI